MSCVLFMPKCDVSVEVVARDGVISCSELESSFFTRDV